jgi:hypothetical protein
MEHLPLELVFRIIHLTLEGDFNLDATRPTRPRQAWYLALVGKQWRDIVESRTFGTITVKSSELDAFAHIYGSQLRRAFLHRLNILLDLPGCLDAAASRTTPRAMRATTRRQNSEAFTRFLRTGLRLSNHGPTIRRATGLSLWQSLGHLITVRSKKCNFWLSTQSLGFIVLLVLIVRTVL